MVEKINELTKENDNLKKEREEYKTQNDNNQQFENIHQQAYEDLYNSIFLDNEKMQSDIINLKSTIDSLENKTDKLTNELNIEKAEREKLTNELNG